MLNIMEHVLVEFSPLPRLEKYSSSWIQLIYMHVSVTSDIILQHVKYSELTQLEASFLWEVENDRKITVFNPGPISVQNMMDCLLFHAYCFPELYKILFLTWLILLTNQLTTVSNTISLADVINLFVY